MENESWPHLESFQEFLHEAEVFFKSGDITDVPGTGFFSKLLIIDKYSIAEEEQYGAHVLHNVNKVSLILEKLVANLVIDLEQVEADLSIDIRADPKAYGVEKITESVVVAVIKVNEDFVKVQEELILAKDLLRQWKSMSREWEKRMDSTHNLVKLHCQEYYLTTTHIGEVLETKQTTADIMAEMKTSKNLEQEPDPDPQPESGGSKSKTRRRVRRDS